MKKWMITFAVFVLAFGLAMSESPVFGWGSEYKAKELRVSKMIGKDLQDQAGKSLGEIKDLLMDPKEPGRVAFVVIEPSHTLDFGHDRLVAIPYPALSQPAGGDIRVTGITRDKLAKAPSFDEDHWPTLSDRAWMAEVFQYYGQSPYWVE